MPWQVYCFQEPHCLIYHYYTCQFLLWSYMLSYWESRISIPKDSLQDRQHGWELLGDIVWKKHTSHSTWFMHRWHSRWAFGRRWSIRFLLWDRFTWKRHHHTWLCLRSLYEISLWNRWYLRTCSQIWRGETLFFGLL